MAAPVVSIYEARRVRDLAVRAGVDPHAATARFVRLGCPREHLSTLAQQARERAAANRLPKEPA